MKIYVVCSKAFYESAEVIIKNLEKNGHVVTYPNCFNNQTAEQHAKDISREEHIKFKQVMYKESAEKIKLVDAILVLNRTKNDIKGYIGGATLLEMYEAYTLNKKIFVLNNIEDSSFSDEILGFAPTFINEDLSLIA